MVNHLSVESIALPSQLDLGYILQIVLSAAKSQWHGCDLLALARVWFPIGKKTEPALIKLRKSSGSIQMTDWEVVWYNQGQTTPATSCDIISTNNVRGREAIARVHARQVPPRNSITEAIGENQVQYLTKVVIA